MTSISGPDVGELGNTKTWKNSQPTSVRSPYVSEGDLGFFSYKKKRYGAFFLAVQTYSRRIFVAPIANTKAESIYKAIGLMLKVTWLTTPFWFAKNKKINDLEVPLFLSQNKAFANTKKLLFDGESALKGAASQARVLKLFGLKLEAQPGFKRNSAERYVREFKTRTRIALDLEGG
jgi:hypothetical protein